MSASVVDVDLYTERDVRILLRVLHDQDEILTRWLRDPEWPLRLDDPAARRELLTGLANVGLVLARLTELVEAPTDDLIERARNARSLREADQTIEQMRGRLIPFPAAVSS